MYNTIKKRNGTVQIFDANKITDAIEKAGRASGEFEREVAKALTIEVLDIARHKIKSETPTVEEIQDIVEFILLESPYHKAAKSYIIYRDKHKRLREVSAKFNAQLVEQYLTETNWKVKENSNISYSLQGLNNYISSEVSKIYWLNEVYNERIRQAHLEGEIHIHDLSSLSVYCVGWDLYDLLLVGFQGVSEKLVSSPAKHLSSALMQVTNFLYTLQGEAAGAMAFSNFDTLLAPFIAYDNLSYKELKQILQEFLFGLNIPTRTGFQTTFSNITLDVKVPDYYKEQNVIIGGEPKKETYKDFQKEMDLFNQAFIELMLEGDANNKALTFPIPTYNITEDFDWESPIAKKIFKLTAKFGVPYFANFVNSDMKPEDVRSMCCRLRLNTRELQNRGGGLFGARPLTGATGVVTINLPQISYMVSNKIEFKERLKQIMYIARDSLEIKRRMIEKFTEQNLYPYTKYYLRNTYKMHGQYWINHFSTIGLIGMNEACLNLLGKDIGSVEGANFASAILDFMRKTILEFQEETGNLYNLEATPAEGASYRLYRIDVEKFPEIANKYTHYTNSTQLPVGYTDDVFEAMKHQGKLQKKYSGGTVFHTFIGEKVPDSESVKMLLRKIISSSELPYITVTPTFSICPEHGYLPGEQQLCPKCKQSCDVYSRVVGYLRPVSKWNTGKQQEYKERKNYKMQ